MTTVIINEILSHQLKSQEELDAILARCCELVLNGQATDPNHWGMVAACVVLPDGGKIFGVNHVDSEGNRIHAERAALNACETVDGRCMIVTTLSPCNRPMADRVGESCSDLIASYDIGLENIYCGYKDPSQAEDGIEETNNPKLRELCKQLADTFLKKSLAESKMLDPDIYGEELPIATVRRIISTVLKQVDPTAKVSVKQTPEGYYSIRSEGLRLDFGITADGGDINANIVNAYSSYPGKNVVTNIFGQCFQAAEQLWGKPAKFVISAQQDRGHGVWQHIAQKLGAEWGGSVMENFADGKKPGRKGLAKRSGVNTKASVSSLRKTAKHSTGEKARMAHWLANMKSGRAKAQKKNKVKNTP